MPMPELMPVSEPIRRLEVFTGAGRRRTWSAADKARIVAESNVPGASVCAVARRHGLTPQQVFTWRRLARRAAQVGAEPDARPGEPIFAPVVVTAPTGAAPMIEVGGADPAGHRRGQRARGAAGGEGSAVILPTGPVRVLVATRPVDFRKGMDGLAALVREQMGADPYAGTVYVFRSRRADRLRFLVWDGSGLVLVAKRLERGAFRWPAVHDGVMRLTPPSSARCSRALTGPACVPTGCPDRPPRREPRHGDSHRDCGRRRRSLHARMPA